MGQGHSRGEVRVGAVPEADSPRTALGHRIRVAEVVPRTARSRFGLGRVVVLERHTVVGSFVEVDSHRRNSRQPC